MSAGEEALYRLHLDVIGLIETSIRVGEKELTELSGGNFYLLDDEDALLAVGIEQPVTFDYETPSREEADESER